MEESTVRRGSETESEQVSELESQEQLRTEHFVRQTKLPRTQNALVAEKTSDMYFSGLMTE